VRKLAAYLKRSPDTASAQDLRRFQLHLVDHGTSPATLNATLMGLKFFFDITLNRGELMAKMQPVRMPRTMATEAVAADSLGQFIGPGSAPYHRPRRAGTRFHVYCLDSIPAMDLTSNRNGPACLPEIINPTWVTNSGRNAGAAGTGRPRKVAKKSATGNTVWLHCPAFGTKPAW
jgi:hypothetical protein